MDKTEIKGSIIIEEHENVISIFFKNKHEKYTILGNYFKENGELKFCTSTRLEDYDVLIQELLRSTDS